MSRFLLLPAKFCLSPMSQKACDIGTVKEGKDTCRLCLGNRAATGLAPSSHIGGSLHQGNSCRRRNVVPSLCPRLRFYLQFSEAVHPLGYLTWKLPFIFWKSDSVIPCSQDHWIHPGECPLGLSWSVTGPQFLQGGPLWFQGCGP